MKIKTYMVYMDDAGVLQVVAVVTAGIIAITSVCFFNIRRSRCIHCTSPCCSVDRELMSAQEMKDDVLAVKV